MNIIQTIKGKVSQVFHRIDKPVNVLHKIGEAVTGVTHAAAPIIIKQLSPPISETTPSGKKINYLVTPISPVASVGKGILSGGRAVGRGAINAFKNPVEDKSLLSYGKTVAGRTLGAITAIEAFKLTQSAASGEPYNPFLHPVKEIKEALGLGINPYTGFAGLGTGLFQKYFKTGVTTIKDLKGDIAALPQIVPPIDFSQLHFPEIPAIHYPDINFQFGGAGEAPVGSFAPALSLSGDAGIRSPDYTPLILALLGAGALGVGGYALLHKKKKRKRIKRGTSSNKHGTRKKRSSR